MFDRPSTFGGSQVFVSPEATEEVARFPDKKWTKRRRRRVIGKYGSWSFHKPCAFRCGPALYVHPKIYAELNRQSQPA
ncbi:MAG: hypothetical protein ACSHW1_17935 [Yoonia sp.]|uniref:hypothetical protein n=1 Tax=Yoonia sp. TaxID=2212373 RepID=UPI003EF11A4C